RVVAVALCYAMGLGLQTFIGLRSARCPHPHRSSLFGLVGVIFAQGGVIGATGALASPFSPLLLSVGIGSLIIYGRSRESAVTLLLISGVTMVLALLPPAWAGPTVPYPYNVALTALSVLLVLYLFWTAVTVLTDAYQRAGATIERMREDVIAECATRARDLEALSSRVAHELKNPRS